MLLELVRVRYTHHALSQLAGHIYRLVYASLDRQVLLSTIYRYYIEAL